MLFSFSHPCLCFLFLLLLFPPRLLLRQIASMWGKNNSAESMNYIMAAWVWICKQKYMHVIDNCWTHCTDGVCCKKIASKRHTTTRYWDKDDVDLVVVVSQCSNLQMHFRRCFRNTAPSSRIQSTPSVVCILRPPIWWLNEAVVFSLYCNEAPPPAVCRREVERHREEDYMSNLNHHIQWYAEERCSERRSDNPDYTTIYSHHC